MITSTLMGKTIRFTSSVDRITHERTYKGHDISKLIPSVRNTANYTKQHTWIPSTALFSLPPTFPPTKTVAEATTATASSSRTLAQLTPPLTRMVEVATTVTVSSLERSFARDPLSFTVLNCELNATFPT